jgi:large subunit ribosomal protein L9
MPMKLILRADVDNLGRLGDLVTVKPGYGRNFLLPQGLAMLATQANQKRFELERKKLQSRMDAMRSDAQSLADKIASVTLAIPVRVGEGNKMYGSVTRGAIAEALKVATSGAVEIDRRKIVLEEPLRALGAFVIPVKLHADVQVDIKVNVVRHDAGHTASVAATKPAKQAQEAEESASASA